MVWIGSVPIGFDRFALGVSTGPGLVKIGSEWYRSDYFWTHLEWIGSDSFVLMSGLVWFLSGWFQLVPRELDWFQAMVHRGLVPIAFGILGIGLARLGPQTVTALDLATFRMVLASSNLNSFGSGGFTSGRTTTDRYASARAGFD